MWWVSPSVRSPLSSRTSLDNTARGDSPDRGFPLESATLRVPPRRRRAVRLLFACSASDACARLLDVRRFIHGITRHPVSVKKHLSPEIRGDDGYYEAGMCVLQPVSARTMPGGREPFSTSTFRDIRYMYDASLSRRPWLTYSNLRVDAATTSDPAPPKSVHTAVTRRAVTPRSCPGLPTAHRLDSRSPTSPRASVP